MGKLEPQMLSYIERVYSTGVYKKSLTDVILLNPVWLLRAVPMG